jgi:hypothetical protein
MKKNPKKHNGIGHPLKTGPNKTREIKKPKDHPEIR